MNLLAIVNLTDRIIGLGGAYPAMDLSPWPYDDEARAPELLRRIAAEVDAVLFTGPIPFSLAMAEVEPALPVTYVPLKGTGLYRTLFHAREQIHLERVSIDTLTRTEVEETYGELGISTRQLLCLEGRGSHGRQRMIQFHLEAYRRGSTTAALTGLYSASQELRRQGVPCYWITPTTADLKGALERAFLMGANQRQGQAALGIIAVEPEEPGISEHERARLRHEIFGLLLRLVEPFDGHLFSSGTLEYQFFATREPFERSFGQAAALEELRQLAGARVSIGVGVGRTANQAGTHARIALHRAQSDGGRGCYLVQENRRLIGPIGAAAEATSALRAMDPKLLAVAKAAGMSGPALDRLVSVLRTFPTFTAADMAGALGVSLRSAHRLLSRLEKAGAIAVAGQEKVVTPGRPRQVYRLV